MALKPHIVPEIKRLMVSSHRNKFMVSNFFQFRSKLFGEYIVRIFNNDKLKRRHDVEIKVQYLKYCFKDEPGPKTNATASLKIKLFVSTIFNYRMVCIVSVSGVVLGSLERIAKRF